MRQHKAVANNRMCVQVTCDICGDTIRHEFGECSMQATGQEFCADCHRAVIRREKRRESKTAG